MSSGANGVIGTSLRVDGRDCGSQKRIVCGTPSSVRVKSFAVRPSIVFPFLSLTTTVSMTICERTDNVGVSLLPGAAFCPICWASAPSVTSRRMVSKDCMLQNLRRIVVCRLRIALVAAGSPKSGLVEANVEPGLDTGFKIVFQAVKTAWLSRFVESTRKSRLYRSFNRKVRASEALNVNVLGPVIEFLRASPHSPASGAAYAAAFK